MAMKEATGYGGDGFGNGGEGVGSGGGIVGGAVSGAAGDGCGVSCSVAATWTWGGNPWIGDCCGGVTESGADPEKGMATSLFPA